MTRPRFSPPTLARVVACLVLALMSSGRLRAEAAKLEAPKPTAAASEAPAPKASVEYRGEFTTAPDPAANKPVVAPKRATDETHGLLNLGLSLTDRGDY